jgi:hypothetical protein
MLKIALVTDVASLPIDYDMPLLLEACHELGLAGEVCVWNNEGVQWARFDAVLLRSPWNCIETLDSFLAWCEDVAKVTRLFNPPSVARWGLDKCYLADIAKLGVPIIPSKFIAPGDCAKEALDDFIVAHSNVREIVIKPTIGSYSRGVQRFLRHREVDAAKHIENLLSQKSHVIIQTYIDSVDVDGETDLVFINNEFSHSIRKSAMLMPDGTVHVPTLEFRKFRNAEDDERSVALAALNAAASCLNLDAPLLYGRVDLIRDSEHKPMVLEMEICEPSLNLPFGEGSAVRLMRALVERLVR